MSVDPLLVFLIIFFGISLCATLICYFIGKMYFITERYFKSRFIKKDDQQKAESPQMRTAESPSIEVSTPNPEGTQNINRESQASTTVPNTQGVSDAPSSSNNNNTPSGQRNVQT